MVYSHFLNQGHQLAKRKADELEDFGQGTCPVLSVVCQAVFFFVEQKQMKDLIPAGVAEEGIQIMEEFLCAWSYRGPAKDGEDIIMTGDDNQDAGSQVKELRSCLEEFRPRIEKNQWLRSVLTLF
jgi:DNA mismatch repair protein MSH2